MGPISVLLCRLQQYSVPDIINQSIENCTGNQSACCQKDPPTCSLDFLERSHVLLYSGYEGECLLISSLPGKALRTHVESLGFRAIQHAFSKPSLVNLISKDTNLVFYLSVYPLFHFSS